MTEPMDINQTLRRFDYPALLVRDYAHWAVLLRRHQATLGSLVLIARADVTAWPEIGTDAFTELATVTAAIERTLRSSFKYDKINYLMLMMNDPNVHFHVIPRYRRTLTFEGIDFADPGWPKTPDLGAGRSLDDDVATTLLNQLKTAWLD
jgi:diadenosine tetraphosphate (Ap4A) HIT family hydrolase